MHWPRPAGHAAISERSLRLHMPDDLRPGRGNLHVNGYTGGVIPHTGSVIPNAAHASKPATRSATKRRWSWTFWTVLALVAVSCAAAIAYHLVSPSWRQADISHAHISVQGTSLFSAKQLNGAVQAILDTKRTFRGCSIDKVDYNEAHSQASLQEERDSIKDNPGSGSAIYSRGIARYGKTHMAVFTTDFTCDAGVEGSGLNPGKTTGWSDYLAYDPTNAKADHGWVWIDGGFG